MFASSQCEHEQNRAIWISASATLSDAAQQELERFFVPSATSSVVVEEHKSYKMAESITEPDGSTFKVVLINHHYSFAQAFSLFFSFNFVLLVGNLIARGPIELAPLRKPRAITPSRLRLAPRRLATRQ